MLEGRSEAGFDVGQGEEKEVKFWWEKRRRFYLYSGVQGPNRWAHFSSNFLGASNSPLERCCRHTRQDDAAAHLVVVSHVHAVINALLPIFIPNASPPPRLPRQCPPWTLRCL